MRRFALSLLLTALAPIPAAASPSATLLLRPSSGTATQEFVATFAFAAPPHAVCADYTAHFTWDQAALADVGMGGTANCTASLTTRPPAGLNAPGDHAVSAYTTPGSITGGPNKFTIVLAGPSPSPRPSPHPSPTPSPSPSPPPPSPSPSPIDLACTAAAVPAAPAATATSAGTAELQGIGGGPTTLIAAGPPQMLPPQLGSGRLIALQLTKAEDDVSPLLQNALTAGTVFPCAYVSLGQTAEYSYARYALQKVTVVGLQSSLSGSLQVEETVTLAYQRIEWIWQGSDPRGRLVTRSGGGAFGSSAQRPAAASHAGGGSPWAWVILALAGLLALGLVIARGRRLWPFLGRG